MQDKLKSFNTWIEEDIRTLGELA